MNRSDYDDNKLCDMVMPNNQDTDEGNADMEVQVIHDSNDVVELEDSSS